MERPIDSIRSLEGKIQLFAWKPSLKEKEIKRLRKDKT